MAAAASVSAAAGDQSGDSGLIYASRPPHEYLDNAADLGLWRTGEGRRPNEVEPGKEDSRTQGRECQRTLEEDQAPLTPEEIEGRLERTRREFYNRRKIIIKNLPSDVSNQVEPSLSNVNRDWLIDWREHFANVSLASIGLPSQMRAAI